MTSEYVLFAVLLAVSIIPLLVVRGYLKLAPSQNPIALAVVVVGLPLSLALASYVHRRPRESTALVTNRPQQVSTGGYQGSGACLSCHPHEHSTWTSSYHRTMTQLASPETLMAPTNGEFVKIADVAFRIRREGPQVWVDMCQVGPDGAEPMGPPVSRQIVVTTGSHHMQLYWYPIRDESRVLGMFPFVYLKDEQRWIPRGAAFLQPGYSMHDELGRWNQTCIACHATNGRTLPGHEVDAETGEEFYNLAAAQSEVAEFGIACEACHGPAMTHVNDHCNPLRRYQSHLSADNDPGIVNPLALPHKRQSQVCGQCHSVQGIVLTDTWWNEGFRYRPGDDLDESPERFVFQVSEMQRADHQLFLGDHPDFVPNHFWPDGMVRISGREYNGLIESPCFQHGDLSCLSCHRMHQDTDDERPAAMWADDQLRSIALDNRACTQCHSTYENELQLVKHTHHPATSAGSDCYNCHMSYTTYGLLKAIRSHQIDAPNAQVAKTTGRPNACNQCHLDRSLGWTATHLTEWYGHDMPELTADEREIADSVLWTLRGDAGLRALAAWSFGWADARVASTTDWIPPYLVQLLNDPYAAVRYIAEKSLRKDESFHNIEYDFLIPASQRRPYVSEALSVWNNSQHVGKPQVLIDDEGRLQTATFRRLLDSRDNRIMVLVE